MNLVNVDSDTQTFSFVQKYTSNQVCPEFCQVVNFKNTLCLIGKFKFMHSCVLTTTGLVLALIFMALTVFGVMPVPEFVFFTVVSFLVFLLAFALIYTSSNHDRAYFVLAKGQGRIEYFDLISQSVSTANILPESVVVESDLGLDELGNYGTICRVNVRRTDGETICILKSSSMSLCNKIAGLFKEQASVTQTG